MFRSNSHRDRVLLEPLGRDEGSHSHRVSLSQCTVREKSVWYALYSGSVRELLTKLIVRNFKRFNDVSIELGNPVVFIGPNNSGKSIALQALALWDIGLRRWNEARGARETSGKRPGVAINRRDLISVPVPDANLLWRDLHVRDVVRHEGKQTTKNVRVDIVVEGVTQDTAWSCGFEFDYANQESFYCRPLRLSEDRDPSRMQVPPEALGTMVAFLPPMSGLQDREFKKQGGEISFLIGQGRTAEVLRNLCLGVIEANGGKLWTEIIGQIERLFGVKLEAPEFISERGEITMTYRDRADIRLDLSSAGRGLHQTLLLLAYLAAHPSSVLLLDEPDAHLEILRQRQIYKLLTDTAREQNSQIIAASHSEVVLNEAAARDVVVSFVGSPHRINDRGSQLRKALVDIGFEDFYQAEENGWVLYVEGSTDLAILQAFAQALNHPVAERLELCFAHYIENQPERARAHFHGLREAKSDLIGIVLCDRLDRQLNPTPQLQEYVWRRREIENYLCQPDTLLSYAESGIEEESPGPLFDKTTGEKRRIAMEECIRDLVPPVALRNPADSWWMDTKASTDFLDRLFDAFFKRLGLPNLLLKTNYHVLAKYVRPEQIDPEIIEKLDAILQVAERAINLSC